ncbi:N-acetylglutaminylglutamine synthetase [Rhodoligotrophos ferricapiens]|uniref:N-acetylglutaminylglutamine synthetase n=1 Tax=Rhodoligotrophos ferricapiens TaxID=3069264 RepID=UPI003D81BA5E
MMGEQKRRGRKNWSRALMAHRMHRLRDSSMMPPLDRGPQDGPKNATLDCGWGRLLFAPTFESAEALVDSLRQEKPEQRDIVIYIRDPHVVVAAAPQELFLDPSHTYRLDLATYRQAASRPRGFVVRRLASPEDADAVNSIYLQRKMVPVPPEFFLARGRRDRALIHLVAEDTDTGRVIGTVTGVDHAHVGGTKSADRIEGSSLWCLAVDPQATRPGIGEALVRHLAAHFQARGAPWLDLSVLHNNAQAIALYEKLGFVRVPCFAVKRKNPINEALFAPPPPDEARLNPYARLIVDEARRRGILVEITDAEAGFFRLTHGARSIHCRESLSELTSAVAMSICDDKTVTRRVVSRAGVRVPDQILAGDMEALESFLAKYEQVVVKPARGEQGKGVAVGLSDFEAVLAAIERARAFSDQVVIEEFVEGQDLRLVVIDYKLVAAAIRRPAHIMGDGMTSVRDLIERQSRRRAAATGGESRIPIDDETERCLAKLDLTLDSVPEAGREVTVRRTANLHTGGTIHDVTDHVHPDLVDAAVRAARAIEIPVTGIDFVVKSPYESDYVFIEANERPGLANHEPQPTAQRFIDLLFPHSMPASARASWTGEICPG